MMRDKTGRNAESTVATLIADLQGIICEAGSEDVEVVVRHCSEHEFSPEDDLRDFYIVFDEKENKAIINVKN